MKKIVVLMGCMSMLISCTNTPAPKKEKPALIQGIKAPEGNIYTLTGKAQGTTYAIRIVTSDSLPIQSKIDSILTDIDNSLSTWNQESLITSLNTTDSLSTTFDDYNNYFSDNFRLSRKVWKESEGAFDPTLFPLINAWGFGFNNKQEMTPEKVDSLKQWVGFSYDNIRLSKTHDTDPNSYERMFFKKNPGIQLEFNAIAQGYSVDVLADYLNSQDITSYMIELGGEVLTKGIKPDGSAWRIGIDKPLAPSEKRELQHIAHVVNKAIATSGSYRKYYIKDGVKYSHTLDPQTGYPVQHNLLSVTVVYDNCALADAYATAFMVMGTEKTKAFLEKNKQMGLDVYLITDSEGGEYEEFMTEGFKAIIE